MFLEVSILNRFVFSRICINFNVVFLYRSSWPLTRRRRWGHFARPFRMSSDRPLSSACQPGQLRYSIRRRWGHCARPFRASSDMPPSSACLPGQFKYYIRGEGGATARGLSERLRSGHRHWPASQVSSDILFGEGGAAAQGSPECLWTGHRHRPARQFS